MELSLTRPLCFFDLETTGVNVAKDRVVEISILKIFPNGNKESKTWLVNPEMPIPPQTTAVHGITDEKVANEPTFKQLSKDIYSMIKGSDLAGFNSDRFDIPLLAEEMLRAEIDVDFKKHLTVDVQTIFHKMEKRNLSAAYKFYCGKKMENAHDALVDVRATAEVFMGQLEMYKDVDYEDADGNIIEKPIRNDMKAIHEFTNDNRFLDATQRLKYNSEGVAVFNFGKYAGQAVVEVLKKDKPYYTWIMTKDFSSQVKQIIKQLVKENEKK